MRFVIFSTTDNLEEGTVHVDAEEFDDFEEMMRRYTLLSSARDNVLVIETENQKVLCQYLSSGHAVFNRFLMDA